MSVITHGDCIPIGIDMDRNQRRVCIIPVLDEFGKGNGRLADELLSELLPKGRRDFEGEVILLFLRNRVGNQSKPSKSANPGSSYRRVVRERCKCPPERR